MAKFWEALAQPNGSGYAPPAAVAHNRRSTLWSADLRNVDGASLADALHQPLLVGRLRLRVGGGLWGWAGLQDEALRLRRRTDKLHVVIFKSEDVRSRLDELLVGHPAQRVRPATPLPDLEAPPQHRGPP